MRVRRLWPAARRPARLATVGAVALAAVVTALTLPAPAGVQWPLIALTVAAAAVTAAPRRVRRPEAVLAALALALTAVPAVRADWWGATLSILAALGLGALAASGARSWAAVVLAAPLGSVASVRALPWCARATRRLPRGGTGSWVRALAVTVPLVWAVGGLLYLADDAFAGLVDVALPAFQWSSLPVRVVLAAIAAACALGLAYLAAAPPRWAMLDIPRRHRPAVEWCVPVVAVAVVLGSFLVVQAAVLFGAYPPSLVSGTDTPAARARHGFGELVVVTLVVVGLLAWAARRSDPDRADHRRLLAASGGALLVGVGVVVASALRRMYLYQQTFGWTVLRLDVAVFEAWLGVVLIVIGVAWLLRRTTAVPRLVVGSAGAMLLALSLAGPEALVASWNVDRFAATGKFDLEYAQHLSDDAVPALDRLPEPQRTCALAFHHPKPGPWYAANVSRLRAAAILRARPIGVPDPQVCGFRF